MIKLLHTSSVLSKKLKAFRCYGQIIQHVDESYTQYKIYMLIFQNDLNEMIFRNVRIININSKEEKIKSDE